MWALCIDICTLCFTQLFSVSGTLRSNLDPFNLHDDATLWDALKRVHLVNSSPFDTLPSSEKEAGVTGSETQEVRQFGLDTVVEDEGNNLSVGQVCGVGVALRPCIDIYIYLALAFPCFPCPCTGQEYQSDYHG